MIRVIYGYNAYEGYAASKTEHDVFIYDENWDVINQISNIYGNEWNYISIEGGDWTDLGDIPDMDSELRRRIAELQAQIASIQESMQSHIDTLEGTLADTEQEMQSRIDILEADLAAARALILEKDSAKLIGELSGQSSLTGMLSIQNGLEEDYPTLTGYLSIPTHYGTIYDGSYEITPSGDYQLIGTMEKFMEEDILVHPIPYSEVSNNAGGYTATIGG